MRTHVHANSIAAYQQEEPKLSKRAEAIYDWIKVHGPHTDREVMKGMGFPDMNNVRPRITELLEAHRLMEVGSVLCSTTNKTVRRVDIRAPRFFGGTPDL
jgi:predicted HTH transcriptional regulator